MSRAYQEYPASARLTRFVECVWTGTPSNPAHPVLPDGCVDIVYLRGQSELSVVGAMTRARTFDVAGEACGVRFRPGMYSAFLRVPGRELTDRTVPLHEFWRSALGLGDRLAEAGSIEKRIAILEASVQNPVEPNAVQRMCDFIVRRRGQIRIDDLAFQAGCSTRQLRRLFLDQTGLTPKHFSRVIRFRHAVSWLTSSSRGDWTKLAIDCGYYDQSHFINEFRELSGFSPGVFAGLKKSAES